MGEQNGPLCASVPLIWHAVNSFLGTPNAVALARAAEAALVVVSDVVEEVVPDVEDVDNNDGVLVDFTVALTPGAVYAVVIVAVKGGGCTTEMR